MRRAVSACATKVAPGALNGALPKWWSPWKWLLITHLIGLSVRLRMRLSRSSPSRGCWRVSITSTPSPVVRTAAFDELIRSLQQRLDLTVFLITHDLDTLHSICDRIAVLADKKVIGVGTIPELLALDHPWIQEYFNGPRGRTAAHSYEEGVVA